MLAFIAVLMVLAIAAAVYIFPRYGKVFSEYKEQRTIYKSAVSGNTAAKTRNEELQAGLEELKTVTSESDAVRDEVFTIASQLEQDILDGKSNKKICYITMDDGPYNRAKAFMKIFKKYDVKATFFLTTANGNKLPDKGDETAASMYPEYMKYGHTIGNHTYSHNYQDGGVYSSATAFLKDVKKQADFTAENTRGYRTVLVRFPGGTGTAGSKLESIEKALRKEGYGWVDWTVDSGDSWGAEKATTTNIKKNVLAAADDGQDIMCVLFHEWSENTQEVMPEIIEELEDRGYIFMPLFYDSVIVQK